MRTQPVARPLFVLFCTLATAACALDEEAQEDERDDAFPTGDKADGSGLTDDEALAVLRLVNNASLRDLDVDVGLTSTAARNIVTRRDGGEVFESLAELDAVPYIGPAALERLGTFARDWVMPVWARVASPDGVTVTFPSLHAECNSADWDPAGDRCGTASPVTTSVHLRIHSNGEIGFSWIPCGSTVEPHTGAFAASCGQSSTGDRTIQESSYEISGRIADRLYIDTFEYHVRSGNQALGFTAKHLTLEAPFAFAL